MENMKGNALEVKRINHGLIFRYLYEHEGASRKQIAEDLRLSTPTVIQHLRELEEENLVEEMGVLASTGGRKATALRINYAAAYAVGVDVTKAHVTTAILDLRGNVLVCDRIKKPFRQEDSFFADIGGKIESLIDRAGIDRRRILGVGVSIPAIMRPDNVNIAYTSLLSRTITLRDFSRYIPYPCRLIHDSNAACLGELIHHAKNEDFVYVFVSSSVGGAIVRKGKIQEGDRRCGGEFGHMTMIPDGLRCYCGKAGCCDPYCNTLNLDRHTEGDLRKFFELLEAGEPEIVKAWDGYLNNLSIMLNNIYSALDNTMIIGGYLGCFIEPYLPRVLEQLTQRNTFEVPENAVQACSFQKFEAAAVGAAFSYIDEFLQSHSQS